MCFKLFYFFFLTTDITVDKLLKTFIEKFIRKTSNSKMFSL